MDTIKINDVDISSFVSSLEFMSEIDEQYIIGNAVAEQVNMTVRNENDLLKDLIDHPFLIGNKTYVIYEKPERWTNRMDFVLYDLMIKTNIYYESTLVYPTTISTQLDEIEQITGVSIDKMTLSERLLNREVDQYDSTMTIRKYLGFIAGCDGKNAFIENDILVFKYFGSAKKEIEYCSDYELNELISISRVCFDDGIIKYEAGDKSSNTLMIDPENTYIEESDVIEIYDHYKNMQFYSFNTFKTLGGKDIKLSDLLMYHDICLLILKIKRIVNGGQARDSLELQGNFTIKNAELIEVKGDNTNIKIKKIQTTVDRNNQTLQIIAEKTEGVESEVSHLTQTVDGLSTDVASGKFIEKSDIGDIYQYLQTLVEQNTESVTMTFVNQLKNLQGEVNLNQQNFERYIRFKGNDIELGDIEGSLGDDESYFRTNITNTEIRFSQNGKTIAYISNSKLYITNAEITHSLVIGKFGFYPRANGSLDFKKVGA